jgi:ribosomal protein L37AE/L43A
VKASARRWGREDLRRRRCPDCRNAHLTKLDDGAWCEDCGKVGKINDFPYQSHFQHLNPKEGP